MDFIRNHKPEWTSQELEIVYKNYNRLNFRQIAELLPNRSFCAVFAKKYNVCRNTVYDILNNKKLYLEALWQIKRK